MKSAGCANSLPPWNVWTEYQGVGWSVLLDVNKLWQLGAGGATGHVNKLWQMTAGGAKSHVLPKGAQVRSLIHGSEGIWNAAVPAKQEGICLWE